MGRELKKSTKRRESSVPDLKTKPPGLALASGLREHNAGRTHDREARRPATPGRFRTDRIAARTLRAGTAWPCTRRRYIARRLPRDRARPSEREAPRVRVRPGRRRSDTRVRAPRRRPTIRRSWGLRTRRRGSPRRGKARHWGGGSMGVRERSMGQNERTRWRPTPRSRSGRESLDSPHLRLAISMVSILAI